MRILANYGVKNGSENYQVTFETTGDVPKDQADSVVDELFSMAKRAIERQINPTAKHDEPQSTVVVIPKPSGGNGNGNGKHHDSNSNGNGNGKPHPKDTDVPISPKQKTLIIKLSKQRRRVIEGLNEMSLAEASQTIKELLA